MMVSHTHNFVERELCEKFTSQKFLHFMCITISIKLYFFWSSRKHQESGEYRNFGGGEAEEEEENGWMEQFNQTRLSASAGKASMNGARSKVNRRSPIIRMI